MELRHLRYFVKVAEEQNVTKAALRLHLSQPSLSRQIRDLEEELKVALFERTPRSLLLTQAGKIFLEEARAVLLRAEEAIQTVRGIAKGERGRLRMGYAPSLTSEMIPRMLRAFEEKHSGVKVALFDLSTEEAIQKIHDRKIDLALIVEPMQKRMRGLKFEGLATDTFCVAVPIRHPFASRKSMTLRDLKNEKWLFLSQEEYPEYHERLEMIFSDEKITITSSEEYDSMSGLITAVEAGRGVALVASSARHFLSRRLKLIPLANPLPPLKIGILTLSDRSLWVRNFIESIQ
jgi:LysR family transcriptional regulator, benzoate and cis,cis-muconate-responsive activator of ben and cat genes